jgi:3-methylfumaryl-CoA hydratase
MSDEISALDADTKLHLSSWIGRVETAVDTITAAPLSALAATLDRDDPLPVGGAELPPLWHWLYFLPHHRQHQIGPDGHPRRGGFLPPVPLPRRMWAGGRFQWQLDNPLRVGDAIRRTSRIESISHKVGSSGDLLFVLVRHEVHNSTGLALTEEHDIVYRTAARPSDAVASPVASGEKAAWQRELLPDEVLLFRYSALTFNGHRIHYDRQYATDFEGYPGLVVHGPLIATLLLDLVRRQAPDARIQSFAFKAIRPTFDQHAMRLNGQPSADGKTVRLWAEDHEDWQTMQGSATLA